VKLSALPAKIPTRSLIVLLLSLGASPSKEGIPTMTLTPVTKSQETGDIVAYSAAEQPRQPSTLPKSVVASPTDTYIGAVSGAKTREKANTNWQIDSQLGFHIAYLPPEISSLAGDEPGTPVGYRDEYLPDIDNIDYSAFLGMGFGTPRVEDPQDKKLYLKFYRYPANLDPNMSATRTTALYLIDKLPDGAQLQRFMAEHAVIKQAWIADKKFSFSPAHPFPALALPRHDGQQSLDGNTPFTSIYLLPRGASFVTPSIRDAEGLTELHRAAGRGDTATVRDLLDHGADIDALDSKMGVSVLHKAIYSGNPETVRLLLQRGALIDLQSPSNGNTPLHDALYFKGKRGMEIIKMLLDGRANLAIKNRAGLTPIDSAHLLHDDAAIKMLEAEWARRFPQAFAELMAAVRNNNLRKLKEIAPKNKALLSVQDEQGFSPLLWAAREGMDEIVAVLLANGADPNQLDFWMKANSGHKAAFWGRAKVMALLVKNGLDINAKGGYNGYTPLHDAVNGGHLDVVRVLLDAGARTDIAGHDGKTALDLARERGDKTVLELVESAAKSVKG
jgi:ankyrin repeat protein